MNNDPLFTPPTDPPPPNSELLKQQMRMRFILAISICSVTLVILIFMLSPFFRINTVVIHGNLRVTDDEINRILNIGDNTHLLLFNTRTARKKIIENTYVNDVTFERVLPGYLYVNVKERRLTAYFEHSLGSFLFLDDYGRVLEVRTFFTEPLPILDGLHFTRFQVGEVLEVPDSAAFNVIVQYAQLLNQYNLINQVTRINVSDSANIKIRVKNKEFNVGGVSNADEKVRTIIAVLNAMPNSDLIPGFMDLREVRGEYFFEISS